MLINGEEIFLFSDVFCFDTNEVSDARVSYWELIFSKLDLIYNINFFNFVIEENIWQIKSLLCSIWTKLIMILFCMLYILWSLINIYKNIFTSHLYVKKFLYGV